MRCRRLVSLALLAIYLQGCYTYNLVEQGPAGLPAEPKAKEQVRITTLDGGTVVLSGAKVVGDTLRGFTGDRTSDTAVRAIPLDSVRMVEARKSDPTPWIVVALVGTVAMVVGLAAYCKDWC